MGLLNHKVAIIHFYLLGDLLFIFVKNSDNFYNRSVPVEIREHVVASGCYYSTIFTVLFLPFTNGSSIWSSECSKEKTCRGCWFNEVVVPPNMAFESTLCFLQNWKCLSHSEPWPFIQLSIQMCNVGDYSSGREHRDMGIGEVNLNCKRFRIWQCHQNTWDKSS